MIAPAAAIAAASLSVSPVHIRLTRMEVSLIGVAFVLLAGAALMETSQIAALQAA